MLFLPPPPQVLEETSTWVAWNLYLMAVSIIGFFVFVLVYNELASASPSFFGVAVALFSRPGFWLTLMLVIGVVVLFNFTAEHFRRSYLATPIDVAMEMER